MTSISFLSDKESLSGSDTVTRFKPFPHREMHWRYFGVTISLGVSPVTEKTQQLEQIERLLGSHTLHGSESLCKLLRYLANHAWEHPGPPPKEYQIATEVFGRQDDFDPHVDSMVRVQAGRLRSKLAEYYATEGVNDQLLVEMPKGNYALIYHPRTPIPQRANGETKHDPTASLHEDSPSVRNWFTPLLLVSIILGVVLGMAADRFFSRRAANAHASVASSDPPVSYQIFWKGFLTSPQEPWVIFSNAAFVGRPDTGMRYFNAARDGKSPILDHYTGVGEVLAVHALDGVFRSLRQDLRVKRGSLFSLDDAKNNDLIFIGSPSENLTLLEIPSTQSFVFKQITNGIRAGNVSIVNVHPQAGEPAQFLATPSDQPLTEDYSVVALTKGLDQSHSVLILAGTTTIGTQAAVEYVCQQSTLEQLLTRLSVSNPVEMRPFEAVIRVKVAKGVPVESELIALRKSPT